MIRQVRGTVLSLETNGIVVDVNGWGVFLYMANPLLVSVGETVSVQTHLCIKQDGLELYGFTDSRDLTLFQLLLSVSGIGPKTALSILTRTSREPLEQAIATRDITYLTRVAGIGKKSAEKLCVELSEKIEITEHKSQGADADVLDTLIALGYTEREARRALASVPMSVTGRDERLKAALSAGR
jgi:Holliday junction DNA helicase RuvA